MLEGAGDIFNFMNLSCVIASSETALYDYMQKKWCNYLFIKERWTTILHGWFLRHPKWKNCSISGHRTVSMKILKWMRKLLLLHKPLR